MHLEPAWGHMFAESDLGDIPLREMRLQKVRNPGSTGMHVKAVHGMIYHYDFSTQNCNAHLGTGILILSKPR